MKKLFLARLLLLLLLFLAGCAGDTLHTNARRVSNAAEGLYAVRISQVLA